MMAMNLEEARKALIEWRNSEGKVENKAFYEARLKYLLDTVSLLNQARREGREEGRRLVLEGLYNEYVKQGIYEVALKMLQSGFEKSVIMDITKLSEEELFELEERGLPQTEDE